MRQRQFMIHFDYETQNEVFEGMEALRSALERGCKVVAVTSLASGEENYPSQAYILEGPPSQRRQLSFS